MANDEREDTTIYRAIMNHDEQYSIWPADREIPLGWNDVGKTGLNPRFSRTSKRYGPICVRSACARKCRRWVIPDRAPAPSSRCRCDSSEGPSSIES
jgi:MbtH-like protein